jgi:hypothetical protein
MGNRGFSLAWFRILEIWLSQPSTLTGARREESDSQDSYAQPLVMFANNEETL